MGASDTLDVLDGYNGTTNVFKIQLQEVTGTYNVRAGAMDINNAWTYTNWYPLSTNALLPSVAGQNWNAVEVDYQALAHSGKITFYLNGTSEQALSHLDNDTWALTSVRLGPR